MIHMPVFPDFAGWGRTAMSSRTAYIARPWLKIAKVRMSWGLRKSRTPGQHNKTVSKQLGYITLHLLLSQLVVLLIIPAPSLSMAPTSQTFQCSRLVIVRASQGLTTWSAPRLSKWMQPSTRSTYFSFQLYWCNSKSTQEEPAGTEYPGP